MIRSRLGKSPAGLALWLGIAVLFFLTLRWAGQALNALNALFGEPQGTVAGQQRQVAGSKDAGLVVTGWVDHNRAPKGTPVTAWYRVSNVGPAPLSDLRLTLYAPGFLPAQRTQQRTSAAGFPIFLGSSRQALPGNVLPQILPGFSRDIRIEMVGDETSGDYMLTASFNWTGAGGIGQEAAVDLGPLRLRSRALEQVAAWKDLAIAAAPLVAPVLVLVLGFVFQTRQQRFVQQRQAWASMLPSSHQNNMKLYMPLVSVVHTFEGRLAGFRESKTDVDRQSAFFELLLALRDLRQVSANGGFYLKNRTGEKLVARCLDDFTDRLLQNIQPLEDLSYVLDAIEPEDSLSSFIAKLSYTVLEQKERALEEQFGDWLKKGGDLKMLTLFHVLLKFEVNAIYSFWYGREERFPFQEYKPLWQEFRRAGPLEGLVNEVHQYVKPLLSWSQRARLRFPFLDKMLQRRSREAE